MRLRASAVMATITIFWVRARAASAQEEPPAEPPPPAPEPAAATAPPAPEGEPPLVEPAEVEAPPPSSLTPTPEVDVGLIGRLRAIREANDVRFPFVFNAPTARLLPGAVIYSSSGVDTGRGLSSQLEVGLGDVAEFGVTVTDLIRGQDGDTPNSEPDGLFPYILAHFKMGVAENRMFKNQPAVALGFRKSFERNAHDHTSQVAELYFVMSKDFGRKLTIHGGGSFWDASLSREEGDVSLHGASDSYTDQLRAFGGIEIRPLADAQIMLELFYVPQFVYHETAPETIELHPELAWGVRYELARWAVIEAGVRIPEIDDVDLLDAQIFGQFKIVSRKLREALRIE